MLANALDSNSEASVVADLDGFAEEVSDFAVSAAHTIDNAVDDELGSKDAVAGPFPDVGSLAGVPGGVTEGVLPAETVPVGYIVGEEDDVGVLSMGE